MKDMSEDSELRPTIERKHPVLVLLGLSYLTQNDCFLFHPFIYDFHSLVFINRVPTLTCRYRHMGIHIIDTYACSHKKNFCKETVLVIFTYLLILILSLSHLLSRTLQFFPPFLFLITSVFLFQVSFLNIFIF